MGYMRHHAICITSESHDAITTAHIAAERIFHGTFARVTPVTEAGVNTHRSFFVAPDGSKEAWVDSDIADDRREEFIDWMDEHRLSDGSSLLDWVLVQYGDDEKDTRVRRHSDEVQVEE